ncbi:putative zinc finger, CCHC-type containing protein [Tanacetum coccineum]
MSINMVRAYRSDTKGVSFDPQPLPRSYTHTTSPSLNIWASEQRRLKPSTRKEPTFSQESQSIADVVASTKTPDVLPIQKVNPVSMFLNSLTQTDKPQNTQFIAPVIKPQKDYEEFDNVESFEHLFMAEPENAESTVQFDAEDYEEHQENLNQETPTEFPKSDIKQYFTFDDVPPSKWRERSIEMLTWCTAELQYYTIDVVIKRFLTRLQGRLRDWYHSLGEYRQLQIQQSISPEAFMSIIYSEFIGSPWEHTTHAREEFLKMKCCSFQKKDLEKHYDRMSQRFYCLNGVDDVNLKQVFLNSFPESLGNEAYRALEARNVTIAQTTLGELYQLILNALAKLCNQKKFLAEFERTGKRLGTACDDKYLQIKCKDKSSCDCTHTKKKFHSKRYSSLSSKPRFSRRSNKKWKFIRKKKQRGRTSDRCFICQKRGHFARNYPDKKRSQALIQALNQVEPVDVSDLESLYSLDDEPSDSVLCTIAYSDFSSDDDSDTDSLENVNPTKASHPRINPDHYQLAKEECEQLVSQGIIEPTTSPWVCEAFYVNKRSEQVRGKLRLVINYQPLNHFLADDKFPLPQKKSLFQHLADARILSKFDLKNVHPGKTGEYHQCKPVYWRGLTQKWLSLLFGKLMEHFFLTKRHYFPLGSFRGDLLL